MPCSPNWPRPGCVTPPTTTPCVSGTPSQAAIAGRHPQRLGSATTTPCSPPPARCLASGELGQHNGLPASIIVTTTLQELEAGAGRGLTGGGTLLPMSDVIRLGSHAHHYLAIFDNGKALALYHTKRLASPAQRSCCTRDRGCTFPGCTMPGLPVRSPPRRPLRHQPRHRHQRPHLGLRPQPRPRRTRLDHPQKQPRPHRMDPTRTPRPRTTPHQHLPPPRKTAPRRRQTTSRSESTLLRSTGPITAGFQYGRFLILTELSAAPWLFRGRSSIQPHR